MRLKLIIIGLLLATLGCNADPRCRRETALLRAEILDLEDKYFITKAQRDEALSALQAQGQPGVAAKILARNPIEQFSGGTSWDDGEVIYDDPQYLDSDAVLQGETIQGDSLSPDSSNIILNDSPLATEPIEIMQPGTILRGQPATRESVPRGAKPREAKPGQSILDGAEELPQNKGFKDPSTSPTSPANEGTQLRTQPRSAPDTIQRTAGAITNPVTEITIDRGQTGLMENESGTPTLSLLLKPRDARGQSRRVAGTLTVSVLDPASTSTEQRIGIWKFLPEELELFFTDPNSAPGIRLSLPFEDSRPQGKEIIVLIRFQLTDGRALETTARIPTASAGSKIKIQQGEDDQLAEREGATEATPVSARPTWRPVR
jgi:hypothetical protein